MGLALDGHGGVFVQLAMLEGETGVMVVLAITTPSGLSLHMGGNNCCD